MAQKEKEEYIRSKLPYEILKRIYKDSRISLRRMGEELGISYHVIKSVLRKLEEEYNIVYTLELDEEKLGFAPAKIVLIKFNEKPNIEIIKNELANDPYVQNAYLAEGDFDLFLHVVGLSQKEFGVWQWKFRVKFNKYNPVLNVADISRNTVGFLPLRSEIIEKSPILSKPERQILAILNENSRIKLIEIARKLKVKDLDRILYIIKKLRGMGIIKRFSALTQNPDKRLFYAFSVYVSPTEKHGEYIKNFYSQVLKNEENNVISDYNVIISTHGFGDGFYICAFKDGEALAKKGPELLKNLWVIENPIIKKSVLTGIMVGKWPFHLEDFGEEK
ncbi:MAG: hypothetical protein ACPLYE_01800 [Candidatus Micrarchaeales archaeon]